MPVSIQYAVPVRGDKVVRSRKHGQQILRELPGVQRIYVDDRTKAFFNGNGVELVKVVITAKKQQQADACYAKAKEMIKAFFAEEDKKTNNAPKENTYKGYYDVPEEADKVFRSPKHGQVTLKEHHPTCQIKVCDRNNTGTVRVIIRAPNKHAADSCFREGDQMVKALLAQTPRSQRTVPTKELSLKENYEEFVKACKILVSIRENMGYDNHEECPEVMELISHRESQGITDHSEIGRSWESDKPMVFLDDLLGYEVPIDDWGEYSEIHTQAQMDNPHLKVV